MADFALYWSQYAQESGVHGEPLTGWYTSREWLIKRLSPDDRVWLFIAGNACGAATDGHRAHVAELFIYKDWQHTQDNPSYRLLGDEERCQLIVPPLQVDRIFRRPGTDLAQPIGIARQTPFELDEGQVSELLTLLRQKHPDVYANAIGRPVVTQIEFTSPDEVPTDSPFNEGGVVREEVNRYERDPRVREACIAAHGTACSVCEMDFGSQYGPVAAGYIHVHHLRPLSEVGVAHPVDPVADLRPVCPNCHAVLHRRVPPYSIEDVRGFLDR